MIVDLHCDTITRLMETESQEYGNSLKKNELHIDIERLKKSKYMLQTFAIFTPYHVVGGRVQCAKKGIERFHFEIEKNKDDIELIHCYNDILKNSNNNKISALLSLEEGDVCNGELSMLESYYNLGVRMIGLTWNYPNCIGHPNVDANKNNGYTTRNKIDGLSKHGIAYIQEMERLGIIIDVSHASDAVFYDVLKHTQKPFIASHSNAMEITNVGRNLTDDMIRAIAKRSGVVGINFCSLFVTTAGNYTYVKDLIKHIKHIVTIGGIDVVAIGSDFDGIGDTLEIKDASMMNLLLDGLLQAGFSQEDIDKIMYKNAMRVFQEILQ